MTLVQEVKQLCGDSQVDVVSRNSTLSHADERKKEKRRQGF